MFENVLDCLRPLEELCEREMRCLQEFHTPPRQIPEDWGKLIGDVPAATAIRDRFMQQAELVEIKGKSYRVRNPKTKASKL